MAVGTKLDGRREAGERTRRRLLEATRSLLAERDEDAVALRDITAAAGANVASVSYHFGSKDALCRATIEQAVHEVIETQIAALKALDESATIDDIAAVLARPVVCAVGGPSDEARARLRIVARVVGDPPPGMREYVASTMQRAYAALLPLLRRAIPGTDDDELRFRAASVSSIINQVAADGMGLGTRPEADVERLLVPVIAGALAGGLRAPLPA
jgi:AcrR family transcriptional regulator